VCGALPQIGPCSPDSAAGTPTSKPCSPRESVLATTRPWPGMVGRLGRCSPGPFSSKACSSIPWVRLLRASERGRVRTRGSYALECPRALATSIARSKHRPWGLEPMVRRRERSIITAARLPSGSDPADARFREALARQPPASVSRSRARELSLPPLATDRDVLPAPPLGGAPHLPRPLPDAALRACPDGPRRCSVRSASRPPPSGDDQLFWSFAPRRRRSRV